MNQLKRGQVGVTLGIGSTSSNTPTYTWTPKAVNYSGGDFAFNGTTTACDGTFVFDFTDLTKYASGTNRWFIGIKDSTTGDITTINSFKLYQGNTLVGTAGSLPKTSDGTQVYAWIDYTFNSYNQLPLAVITTDRITGDAPLTVRLDGSSSSSPAGNAISGYFWTFGDGASAFTASVDHTYQSPGQYTATLTVTDSQNNTGSKSVTIAVSNPPPTVSFTANPVSGNLPLTVNFDATACNDSNGIASYAWSFGDGTNVTTMSPTISHIYSNGGTYTAKLTVTDNLGASSSANMVINVIDPSVLNAPTNLIIQAGGRKATLTWSDKSGNESGFYIERGVKSRSGIKYSRVGTAGANVTTYTDSLTTASTYYYRIQAYNANSVSGYSNAVSARIK